MQKTQIIGIFHIPETISFEIDKDCFGKRLNINLSNNNWEVRLPKYELLQDLDSTIPYCVTTPDIPSDFSGITKEIEKYTIDPKFNRWGSVDIYNKATGAFSGCINAMWVLGSFPSNTITRNKSLSGNGHPVGTAVDNFYLEIQEWFEITCEWLAIATRQHLDHEQPLNSVKRIGADMEIAAQYQEGFSHIRHDSGKIQLYRFDTASIKWGVLKKASRKAEAKERPPDSYLLYSEAVKHQKRFNRRLAVVEASSAVELVLTKICNHHNISVGKPPTLGRRVQAIDKYVKQHKSSSLSPLPQNTQTKLVDVRNNVIHQQREPTPQELEQVLNVSQNILKKHEPLEL